MVLDSVNQSNDAMTESDSVRDFLNTIEDFIRGKAYNIAAARRKLGLPGGLTERDKGKLKGAKGERSAARCLLRRFTD